MSESYGMHEVEAFTAGAIGKPGQRVFYLQARQSGSVVSLKLEKQQVSALAQALARVLDDLPQPDNRPMPDSLRLAEPVDPAFTVGRMGLGYDRDVDRVIVTAEEVVETDDEGEPLPGTDPSTARFLLTRGQAAAFAELAPTIVAAGRPACRFCGRPMDPDGHHCPKWN